MEISAALVSLQFLGFFVVSLGQPPGGPLNSRGPCYNTHHCNGGSYMQCDINYAQTKVPYDYDCRVFCMCYSANNGSYYWALNYCSLDYSWIFDAVKSSCSEASDLTTCVENDCPYHTTQETTAVTTEVTTVETTQPPPTTQGSNDGWKIFLLVLLILILITLFILFVIYAHRKNEKKKQEKNQQQTTATNAMDDMDSNTTTANPAGNYYYPHDDGASDGDGVGESFDMSRPPPPLTGYQGEQVLPYTAREAPRDYNGPVAMSTMEKGSSNTQMYDPATISPMVHTPTAQVRHSYQTPGARYPVTDDIKVPPPIPAKPNQPFSYLDSAALAGVGAGTGSQLAHMDSYLESHPRHYEYPAQVNAGYDSDMDTHLANPRLVGQRPAPATVTTHKTMTTPDNTRYRHEASV